ncbi:MAG: serine/threonine protein kinase [Planctomycetota bacterium]|mgnify:CR=1 FL=1|nr:MAG: serine/threonine protein kinase [Planctomycetota bacterium]REJ97282.1 MAG: serine/threonine protein kinase [Planctomycetota bacterium]REK21208.1 MAG: serine/threonine protein kinase [Planctomycetota bacterium]REK29616.1 MAG: serine/threonine protein kinase [Planctomycetota bacterium]
MNGPAPPKTGSPLWIWPFELTEQIGEGGMGVVYRARYVVNNRQVAVKMLPADVNDKTALARFEREMAVLKEMRHPNIVRCFGGVCEDKRRFYAMELVEGGSLEDVLEKRGRLSWEQVVEYALQMCAALDCSHKRGVIHRDVKPGNFLIAANGTLKLSDFGLASVAASRRITHAGKTAGTFLYMAPEQIRGGEVTPQTDLYALGCVLFELLTGRPPFVADTPAGTLHLHCKQPAPRVSEFALDVPAALDQLVLQLMEKDPAKRPESAAAVARTLRGVTQTVTVVSSPRKPGVAQTVGNRPVTVAERPAAESETTPAIPAVPEIPRWMAAAFAGVTFAAVWLALALVHQRSVTAEWEQYWISALQDPDPTVRVAAARGLGEIGGASEAGMEALAESISSEDPALRLAGVTALGNAGAAAKPYRPRLIARLKQEPEEAVRTAANLAIQRIDEAEEPAGGGSYLVGILVILVLAAGGFAWYRRRRAGPSGREKKPGPPIVTRTQ